MYLKYLKYVFKKYIILAEQQLTVLLLYLQIKVKINVYKL